ncbi:MAG: murein transglycosylase [Flavobacteriales bacterium]|nr:murein transglycosylase [Flavobacteriales bacterium]
MAKSLTKALLYSYLLIASNLLMSQINIDEKKYQIHSINIPVNLNFANEKLPLQKIDIRERLDKELLINTYWQSRTILLIKRSKKYFSIIEKILSKNQIPDDFKYLAVAESGLENVTSPSNAKGFWQFLEKTGKEYNLEINKSIDERYHLEKSTQAACEYFKKAYDVFQNWTLVAAAYNMGISGLKNKIEQQKVNNYYDLMLNNETYRYIFRIIAIKEIIENYNKYGFFIDQKDFYKLPSTNEIEINREIKSITDFAISNDINYKIIKILNPWILGNSIPNPQQKKYKIKLPKSKNQFMLQNDTIIHICSQKENIYELARKYDVSINSIIEWNKILPSKKLKKNQRIIILK